MDECSAVHHTVRLPAVVCVLLVGVQVVQPHRCSVRESDEHLLHLCSIAGQPLHALCELERVHGLCASAVSLMATISRALACELASIFSCLNLSWCNPACSCLPVIRATLDCEPDIPAPVLGAKNTPLASSIGRAA